VRSSGDRRRSARGLLEEGIREVLPDAEGGRRSAIRGNRGGGVSSYDRLV
jgi:hypothetical protein